MSEIVPIPAEAEQALLILKQTFGHSLLAAYLHGSAVAGACIPTATWMCLPSSISRRHMQRARS